MKFRCYIFAPELDIVWRAIVEIESEFDDVEDICKLLLWDKFGEGLTIERISKTEIIE